MMKKMEGKRRNEEDIQDRLVVQEGMIVKFPFVPVSTFSAPASRFLPGLPLWRHTKTQHHELSVGSRGTRSHATCHPALFTRTV